MDNFAQIKRNTVDARKQLKETESVRFENADKTGLRVMFVGNSITLHGVKPDIGWNHCFGMAASAKEKDYVHRLMAKIQQKHNDAAFCICQVAEWEWQYANGSAVHPLYDSARAFEADIIVVRFLENCPCDGFDGEAFKRELEALLRYLNPSNKAKIILTTAFWRHPGDEAMCEFAEENTLPLVKLGDLGEDESMKALGLFEHAGVANHPGDLGMQHIADRIFAVMESYL